jgi:hypothetical protein
MHWKSSPTQCAVRTRIPTAKVSSNAAQQRAGHPSLTTCFVHLVAAAAKQAIRKTVQATPPPPPAEENPAATGPTGQEAAIAAMMQNMKIPGSQKSSSGPRKQTSAEAPDEERCVIAACLHFVSPG